MSFRKRLPICRTMNRILFFIPTLRDGTIRKDTDALLKELGYLRPGRSLMFSAAVRQYCRACKSRLQKPSSFFQKRVGRYGRELASYMFRTMYVDNDSQICKRQLASGGSRDPLLYTPTAMFSGPRPVRVQDRLLFIVTRLLTQ